MTNLKILTQLPPEVDQYVANHPEIATGAKRPNYRAIYAAAVNNEIPASYINGRWYFDLSDVPVIASRLGLVAGRHAA